MSECSIRFMAAADIPAVEAIEQTVHIDPWPTADLVRALMPPYRSWAALSEHPAGGTSLVGYAIFQWLTYEATLMNVAVAANWQGRGIARALMNDAIQAAEADKLEAIFLDVRVSNQAAIGLYERLGFIEIDRRPGYYACSAIHNGQREDGIVMSLPIITAG